MTVFSITVSTVRRFASRFHFCAPFEPEELANINTSWKKKMPHGIKLSQTKGRQPRPRRLKQTLLVTPHQRKSKVTRLQTPADFLTNHHTYCMCLERGITVEPRSTICTESQKSATNSKDLHTCRHIPPIFIGRTITGITDALNHFK